MRYILLWLLMPSFLMAQEIEVFLIGDAGEPVFPTDSNLDHLSQMTDSAGPEDILIFLGDNVYPLGIPPKDDPRRLEMEHKLDASLQLIKRFKGRSIIIPGNHDWQSSGKNGVEYLLEMQDYVDTNLGKENVFLPRNGCPGPVEYVVSDELVILILDTQYLLHPYSKRDGSDCGAVSTVEVINQLRDLINDHSDKNIIVAAHHPMYSNGPHGGKFSARSHLFPFSDANRKLVIPLPVLGSIYPLYRKAFGLRQDISHPKYQVIRNEIVDILESSDNIIYVNGHEHALQYIMKDSIHYITSGSGSKSGYVRGGKGSQFASEVKGFAKIGYAKNGEVTLSFYDGYAREQLFAKTIFTKVPRSLVDPDDFQLATETKIEAISTRYYGFGKAHLFWLGTNYRDLWATPVEMPVFDIAKEHGGLSIVKMGGGNQTKSLRLEAEDGRQFVLRSLEKYTEKLLPDILQQTIAGDILQDQISGSNPYGAFAIPPLAEAAAIYHTDPQLVMVSDDPRFGKYQETFANMAVLYEGRANDEIAENYFDGKGEDVKGTPDLILELKEDNDESVDQPFALRSRLFDMLIGDWDRHEDQWRWVRRDTDTGGHIWRPIPRDRDQAFYMNEGVLGWLVSRRFVLPNTEGFDEKMDYAPGFNTSARFFDRTFLNALSWKDWEKEIAYLQKHMTDHVFIEAMKEWPDTIQVQAAEQTVNNLKARREDMVRYARDHYLFISKEVEITGSDKHEFFLIERLNPSETLVRVYKRKKDGEIEQVIYERTFKSSETKEIRIYGLGGEDVFEIKGEAKKGIKVRIIGGDGEDKILDTSKVNGISKQSVVYDSKETSLVTSGETKSRLSRKDGVNFYNRTAFEYDKFVPLLSAQYNRDDGLFLGAGFIYTKEGWRKEPFAQKHQLKANAAIATGAVNVYYEGVFTDVIGSWDLNTDLSLQQPFSVSNFFGFGNESTFDYRGEGPAAVFEDEIDYYRFRYNRSATFIGLGQTLGVSGMFKIGMEHLSYKVDDDVTNKFINSPSSGIAAADLYSGYQFLGLKTALSMDTRDDTFIPSKGLTSELSFTKYYGLNETSSDFTNLAGSFGMYLSIYPPKKIVFATRFGVQHLIGDAQFFNGATLGMNELRGYRRTRFIGNTSFYNNVDLRIHLFNIKTYFLPMGVGLVGFHDIGRVWYDGETSEQWHSSKGVGLWLAPLNRILATFHLAFSDEETLPLVTFGYQF